MVSRRTFLKSLGLGAIGAGGASLAAFSHLTNDDVILEHKDLYFQNLPKSFEGYKIGFVSDVHIGPLCPIEWTETAVKLLNSHGIDILTLGGDYLWVPDTQPKERIFTLYDEAFKDIAYSDLPKAIFATAASLFSSVKAPDGIFAVYGNHDRWMGAQYCVSAFVKKSISILQNELKQIRRGQDVLSLVGMDDYWTGIPKLPHLPERDHNHEFRVIISHNPDFLSESLDHPHFDYDLALAGHTHGGQIKIPFFGAPTYNIRDLRFKEGLFIHKDTQFYTSRGIGVVEIPYRINCPAEATVITLKRA